jgi:acetyl esterase/lipase
MLPSRTTVDGSIHAHHEGDEDPEIAQTLAATGPNAQLFVYPGEAHYFAEHDQQAAALLHRRALDFLQALVGDEFRPPGGLTL